MEKLSIEQKAKAYDEAISMAKKFYTPDSNNVNLKATLEMIFPELKESDGENERIRKELLAFLHQLDIQGYTDWRYNSWIAWLEKQCEPELPEDLGGYIVELSKQFPEVSFAKLSRIAVRVKNWLEKQGEQKPADKVEPKFKIGEWVVDGIDMVYQIKKIKEDRYLLQLYNSNDVIPVKISTIDNDCHLWTIEDAKDGDVLCYKDEISLYKHDIKNCTKEEATFGGFVYHCCYDGKRFITNSLYSLTEQDKIDIHPATKEQRDTLMKAMAEAGYTFDFEKKELKKIEQKHAEWNEEDERLFSIVIDILDRENHLGNLSHTDLIACVRKLKSLKPQNQWKPSEEQMTALLVAVGDEKKLGSNAYKELYELYLQIKNF